MTLFLAALAMWAVSSQAARVNPQAAALQEFSTRLDGYLQLRQALAGKLEPLAPTASVSDLHARQQALAAALRHARARARPGDLIPVAVQEQIRATAQADFERRAPATQRAVLKEVPDGPLPAIGKTYPGQAALPTVPPLLLASLPRLPDNLQYRFYGRHIVLLDSDVQIVVDYVRDALPR